MECTSFSTLQYYYYYYYYLLLHCTRRAPSTDMTGWIEEKNFIPILVLNSVSWANNTLRRGVVDKTRGEGREGERFNGSSHIRVWSFISAELSLGSLNRQQKTSQIATSLWGPWWWEQKHVGCWMIYCSSICRFTYYDDDDWLLSCSSRSSVVSSGLGMVRIFDMGM